MNREFIPSMNPAASVTAWEVSPCLELPDYEGGSDIQAFETFEEAESASDEAAGPVFWGVYARMSENAIAAGALPAVHIKDFETHADAMAFVRLVNGDEGFHRGLPGPWIAEPADRPSFDPAAARLVAAAPTLLATVRWIAEQDYLTQSADIVDRARAALRAALA